MSVCVAKCINYYRANTIICKKGANLWNDKRGVFLSPLSKYACELPMALGRNIVRFLMLHLDVIM